MAVKGQAPVTFTQGEAYLYAIQFDAVSAEIVTDVVISSGALGFCHKLTHDTANPLKWTYQFTKEETMAMQPIETTYNLTIYSSSESINPQILVNQPIAVIENVNKPSCVGGA